MHAGLPADRKILRDAKIRQASLQRPRLEAALADCISWDMGEVVAIEEAAVIDDGDEVAWHTYKGQLTEKQEKTRDKIIKRILFLLKIADPSGEADQKRDSRVKDKKPDKAEVPVSATKKQPPTQGTKEK
ncbi:hypothetical protein POTOM_055185 [Populus tomentosa]|uniref:Uncharacterized protein n=1 Tax=Populus tomentosa TaxID=118781 RepID=A0A8X8C5M3_POPTO|nr:hypothetical protein POTOM_055185 [Populus tomentosa]